MGDLIGSYRCLSPCRKSPGCRCCVEGTLPLGLKTGATKAPGSHLAPAFELGVPEIMVMANGRVDTVKAMKEYVTDTSMGMF